MWSDVVFYNDAENWGWETPDGYLMGYTPNISILARLFYHDRVNVVYKAVSSVENNNPESVGAL